MTHEEALEVMAKERGCEPTDVVVCEAECCTNELCLEHRALMNQPSPKQSTVRVVSEWPKLEQLALPTDAKSRNEYPLWDGLFGYFGPALAAIAHLSFKANEQHNPGEPLHWARDKSTDHKNKILKHLLDSDYVDEDTDGELHATKAAWRAIAFLQVTLEKRGAPRPPNAY